MELKIIYLIKLKKINGIGCFIEDVIEQAHQFGNLDDSRTGKWRDREKIIQSSFNVRMDRFKWKSNKKTVEVKENSKRKRKQKNSLISKKKTRQSKRQLTRQECIETAPLCNIDVAEDLSLRKR